MSKLRTAAVELARVDYDPFAGGELTTTAPSSEPQREVWMSARLGPEASCAFNESFTLEFRGLLDEGALQRALSSLAERHEALRSTLSPDGATVCVPASAPMEAEVLDLRHLAEHRREAELAERLRREVEEPFDLERGPLARAILVRLGDERHDLIFTAHHIVCDGWSTAILIRDLRDLYAALRGGVRPALPPAPCFSAYALEQAERGASSGHEDYWIQQFEGSVPVLDLPTDEPRGGFRTFTSRRYDHAIDPELLGSLKSLAAHRRCSFFSLLLAGFTAYLHRLTGDDDIVVGVPAAGQISPGWGDLVGHCVSLLPIRTVIDGTRTFGRHLERTRALVLDAFEHKDYTFGSLIRRLAVPRDPGRIPLVSVMFNVDRALGDELNFEGLDVAFHANPRHFENFELFVNAVEHEGALSLQCQYNRDLFSEETIRSRMAGYEALLRAVVNNPESAVHSLPVMASNEFTRIMLEWNRTREDFPDDNCVHQLIAAQVGRTPGAIAARGPDVALSYEELDIRANRLARYLGRLGVGPGSIAAVALSRTPDLVVGLLAVLKTGGAYLPLDPEYPHRRLSFMLEDSGAAILLTEEKLVARIPDSQARVVLLDTDADKWDQGPDTAPAVRSDPSAPAYVIYTSGSTGQPKGVLLPHRAVVNFLTSMAREPGLSAEDVLLAITTVCFDISVLELFLPLMVGACVCIADEETVHDPRRLMKFMEEVGATTLQATPATWQMLVDAGWRGPPGFKALCGGEALSPILARALVERATAAWNLYGPTETTVWSTRQRLTAGGTGFPPIGRPIGNTRVVLLDAFQRPVPIGVPGEIYIGGAGVAIGYLNRPELTAERFVPDPFAPGGGRLYRTGDIARWGRDGALRFEQRIDTQVKVRGFRIELGEIDANLMEHPDVSTSATLALTRTAGDSRLVSCYVASNGAEPSAADLRGFLAQRIPGYMIPQHFARLVSLPKTLNGKVDRKALAAMELGGSPERPSSTEPSSPAEQALATIWSEVLGIDHVGVEDDFFDLGGHSILAVRVATRLSDTLGLDVPLRRILATPLLGVLARHIEVIQGLHEAAPATGPQEEVTF